MASSDAFGVQLGVLYRLEFDGAIRKNPASAGFGFAILEDISNKLIFTANGSLPSGTTTNEAQYTALILGLKSSLGLGVQHVRAVGDAELMIKQVQGSTKAKSGRLAPLLHLVREYEQQLESFQIEYMDSDQLQLAAAHSSFALDLHHLLCTAAPLPPSQYFAAARKAGGMLGLSQEGVDRLAAADDWVRALAQVVSVRCGLDLPLVLNCIDNDPTAIKGLDPSPLLPHPPTSTTTIGSSIRADPLPQPVLLMTRRYSVKQGTAYAAAYGQALGLRDAAVALVAVPSKGPKTKKQKEAAAEAAADALKKAAKQVPFPLPIGFYPLPPALGGRVEVEEEGEGAGEQGAGAATVVAAPAAGVTAIPAAAEGAAAGTAGEEPPSPLPAAAAADDDEDDLAELCGMSVIGDGEGEGGSGSLGEGVESATHLLRFDGASRNNPGRAGYGFVIYDLRRKVMVGRGCHSLPYGQTAGQAEFHGAVAGLEAAVGLGIRRLAIQGDSDMVISSLLTKKAGVHSQKLLLTAAQLMAKMEHIEVAQIPRSENRAADRLANIAMDVDSALHSLLRYDHRGKDAISLLLRSAKIQSGSSRVARLVSGLGPEDAGFVLLALMSSIFGLSPAGVLGRMEDKAARMGDRNPWWVQEIRRLVHAQVLESAQEGRPWDRCHSVQYDLEDLARRYWTRKHWEVQQQQQQQQQLEQEQKKQEEEGTQPQQQQEQQGKESVEEHPPGSAFMQQQRKHERWPRGNNPHQQQQAQAGASRKYTSLAAYTQGLAAAGWRSPLQHHLRFKAQLAEVAAAAAEGSFKRSVADSGCAATSAAAVTASGGDGGGAERMVTVELAAAAAGRGLLSCRGGKPSLLSYGSPPLVAPMARRSCCSWPTSWSRGSRGSISSRVVNSALNLSTACSSDIGPFGSGSSSSRWLRLRLISNSSPACSSTRAACLVAASAAALGYSHTRRSDRQGQQAWRTSRELH